MTPFGLVLEAERQGLDAIAITGSSRGGRTPRSGDGSQNAANGPIVLVGEEIIAPEHHVIAVGIDRVVSVGGCRLEHKIDDVHAQGGVAIAAHPIAATGGAGLRSRICARRLDGADTCHPLIYPADDRKAQGELEAFAASTSACGHRIVGLPRSFMRLGICRTYVFARDRTRRRGHHRRHPGAPHRRLRTERAGVVRRSRAHRAGGHAARAPGVPRPRTRRPARGTGSAGSPGWPDSPASRPSGAAARWHNRRVLPRRTREGDHAGCISGTSSSAVRLVSRSARTAWCETTTPCRRSG